MRKKTTNKCFPRESTSLSSGWRHCVTGYRRTRLVTQNRIVEKKSPPYNIILAKLDQCWVSRICTNNVTSESHTTSLLHIEREMRQRICLFFSPHSAILLLLPSLSYSIWSWNNPTADSRSIEPSCNHKPTHRHYNTSATYYGINEWDKRLSSCVSEKNEPAFQWQGRYVVLCFS